MFHKHTLLYRLLEPLQRLFRRHGKRRKIGKDSSKKDYSKPSDIVSGCISRITALLQEDEGVCWKENLSPATKPGYLGLKLLQLYRALLQGPLTHLIRREELDSAAVAADACMQFEGEEFMKAMVSKSFLSLVDREDKKGCAEGRGHTSKSNILENIRMFTGALFSAAVVDKGYIDARLLPSFGEVLHHAVKTVSEFYIFYDEHKRRGGSDAAEYAKNGGSGDFLQLRDQFLEVSTSERFQPSWGVDYDDMYVTGSFFPDFPQVRPLPFNDKSSKVIDEDAFGFCSKHYLQRNASITPGALTFACSCSHPIIFGFKVLERDEGPRAVLDVLVSRFPIIPRFIIYDFACGVYKGAISTLWWVVEDSTLVSDLFHGGNHTCSPAFLPSAHVRLNMVNTISHEQRNRPVAKIKGSLQQTGQDVYISLLAFQVIINNIEAKGRTVDDSQDPVPNRSAKDIEWTFFHRLKLTCPCCAKQGSKS